MPRLRSCSKMGIEFPFPDTMIGSDSCITTVIDVGKADKKPIDSFAVSPIFRSNKRSLEDCPNDDNPSILSTMLSGSGNNGEFPNGWKLPREELPLFAVCSRNWSRSSSMISGSFSSLGLPNSFREFFSLLVEIFEQLDELPTERNLGPELVVLEL